MTHIYNVTTKVEDSIEAAWKHWLLQEHIPRVMATGCFEKYQVVKLLDDSSGDGTIYTVSYYLKDLDIFEKYISEHADQLRGETILRWGQQMIAFRSVMEVVAHS